MNNSISNVMFCIILITRVSRGIIIIIQRNETYYYKLKIGPNSDEKIKL